jgi:hypothetical protein
LFVENLDGRLPVKGLAGAVVECKGDGFEVLGGPARKVGSLRKILAQSTIRRSYVCQPEIRALASLVADSITR